MSLLCTIEGTTSRAPRISPRVEDSSPVISPIHCSRSSTSTVTIAPNTTGVCVPRILLTRDKEGNILGVQNVMFTVTNHRFDIRQRYPPSPPLTLADE